MLKITLASAIAIFMVASSFAAGPPYPPDNKMTTPPDGNVFFTDTTGRHALDPVCGMYVTVDMATHHYDHNDKRYFFCSEDCHMAFKAKPSKYLEKLVIPANVVAIKGNKLTAMCPVSDEHVEVDKETLHQVYNGKDYFFCCNKCPKPFAKDPEKYTSKKVDSHNMMKDGHDGHMGH